MREYAFFKKLCELPFVDAIYRFGGTDEHEELSLAVLCPEANDADWNKVRKIAHEADILVKVEVTRLDRVPENTTLRARIEREREALFIRETKSHASLMHELLTLMQWHIKVLQDAMEKEFASAEERRKTLAEHFRKTLRHFWRYARKALIVHGVRAHSPLATLKNANMEGWLKDRALWEQMFHDWQHLIPHGTKDALERIEKKLPEYVGAIEAAAEKIKKAVISEVKK